MDIDATSSQALYLYKGRVLSRDMDGRGFPLDPQPFLVRAFYVSPEENLQLLWPNILVTLKEPKPKQMLQLLVSPDGPPYRANPTCTDKYTVGHGADDSSLDSIK